MRLKDAILNIKLVVYYFKLGTSVNTTYVSRYGYVLVMQVCRYAYTFSVVLILNLPFMANSKEV